MDDELYATTIERIELKTILKNLQDGVLTLNLGREVTTVNQALCRMLGADETELLGRPCAVALGETAGACTLEVFEAALAGDEAVERDSEIRHRSGEKTPVAISAVPLRDFLGATVGGVCLFQDITRRKEIEALYEQMRALDKIKNDLTHMIVHDLRTPLTSLLGGLQTLAAISPLQEKEEMERELLEISIGGGETLLGMINDLLDISKMEEGSLQLERRELAAADVVDQALQQVASLAAQQQLALAREVAPDLPRFWGDEDKLRRTLVNLLGNAIKFTPVGGTVTISVRADDEENTLLFAVRDTGEGIPPEAFERIFEKFGRSKTARRAARCQPAWDSPFASWPRKRTVAASG
jgi:PAS domain S-box-containing protein